MSKTIIGVMGPGSGAEKRDKVLAFELGSRIAQKNWVLLTGGRNVGVMHEASRGAKSAGGLTVGVLPTAELTGISEFVDIPIRTGMGSARNNINVLSSDVVVACGAGLGTISEIVLAYKAGKPVILLNQSQETIRLMKKQIPGELRICTTSDDVIKTIEEIVEKNSV